MITLSLPDGVGYPNFTQPGSWAGYNWAGAQVGDSVYKLGPYMVTDYHQYSQLWVNYIYNFATYVLNLPSGKENPYTLPLVFPYLFPDAVIRYNAPLRVQIPWTVYYSDFLGAMPVQNTPLSTVLQNPPKATMDLFSSGVHAPVFTGRVDLWSPSSAIGDGSTTTDAQYTGVDLGQLRQGDVVMVAADADTGYIWFGKNGTWYLSDGTQVSASDQTSGPNVGTGWAAVMDGGSKSVAPQQGTSKPKYYPAVGYRIGNLKFNILLTGFTKYSPPSSFKIYGA
jgi:hypothetical protein